MTTNFRNLLLLPITAVCCVAASKINNTPRPAVSGDPKPGEPLVVTMGQRKPVRVRVALNQATLIRLPAEQRVMNVYGGDKGEGGIWSVDAGKVPTRFLAVKPKEKGVHTTLHIISNTGQEISLYLDEVTGVDSQFDAEVDADPDNTSAASDVKWVPADEALSCKTCAASLGMDLDQFAKKAERELVAEKAKTEAARNAALAEYQSQYPHKLFFGYTWDRAKALKMGLEAAWSDDKFTYFKGTKVLSLYEINEDGKPSLIQYSYANGVYTVPKILYDGYFAIGTKNANKLTFHREKGKS